MDLLQALSDLPKLVEDYKVIANRLIEAEKELTALKEDTLVGWDWTCNYLDVDRKTARLMLAEVKIFVHGRKVKKFKRSDIIRFAERHSVKVKDLQC